MRHMTLFIVALSFGLTAFAASHAQEDVRAGVAASKLNVTVSKHGDGWYFATSGGMALYIFDKDEAPGKSACNGDCAKDWPPYAAPADAQAVGGWSVITRADGTRQWAYRDKPVYAYAKEGNAETTFGDGFGGIWHLARQPISVPLEVTFGKTLQGSVLADLRGYTLYYQDSGKSCVAACLVNWSPLAAPWAAIPTGDWTPVVRDDGTKQWAYKGKLLYTYGGEILPGETQGDGVDRIWHAALLEPAPPKPSWVTFQESDGGELIADSAGHTVYTYNTIRGIAGSLTDKQKRDMDAGICDVACRADTWLPVVAAADAKPMGNWTLVEFKDEGTRVWAYKGKPLYTNKLDEVPGQFKGVNFADLPWKVIMRSGIPMQGTSPAG